MAKYDRSGRDPYVDPRTGILRNRVGATDQATLDAREVEFTTARTFELALRPGAGSFDLRHLQRIHGRLFGDVYDWAGELRTVDISRGGSAFAHHAFLQDAGTDIFGQLAREAGYRVAWDGMTREAMTNASIAAMFGDARPLAAFLAANLRTTAAPP